MDCWGVFMNITIKDVAKQYGMIMKEKDGVTTFTAPKARMQMFVEKLHFAGSSFYVLWSLVIIICGVDSLSVIGTSSFVCHNKILPSDDINHCSIIKIFKWTL